MQENWETEFFKKFPANEWPVGNVQMARVKDFIAEKIKEAYERGERENRFQIKDNRGWKLGNF
jgi:hypothetical protein